VRARLHPTGSRAPARHCMRVRGPKPHLAGGEHANLGRKRGLLGSELLQICPPPGQRAKLPRFCAPEMLCWTPLPTTPVDVTFYVFCGVPTVFGFGRDFLAASHCLSSVYVAEATSGRTGQKRGKCGHSPSTAGHSARSPPLQLRGPLHCQTALADSVFRAPTPDRNGISWIITHYIRLYSICNPPAGELRSRFRQTGKGA
jgi:hypothetical protein